MANTKNLLQTLFMIIIITINIHLATCATARDHFKELALKKRIKLTHLHFYLHDVISSGQNPTDVGVAGPQLMSNSINFGFVSIFDDPMTVGPELSSKRIGSAQGLFSSASQTEIGIFTVFTEGKFNGSTLGILGRDISAKVREMPVVGGTGVFRFARGFALESDYFYNTTSFHSIVEYNVYVLHY